MLNVSSAVICKQLNVRRGQNHILHDLDLQVPSGAIIGLLGPSGSGKTTLMRSIVGLQTLMSGSIEVLGFAAGTNPVRTKIGYSTQSASIYSDLSCIENVRYFAALYPKSEKSPEEILENVDLSSHAHRLARSLSGGERARLALATALVGSPEILFLDEPTVGLDPLLKLQIWKLFAGLVSQGKTLFVSSHVMEEADNCQELFLLREGRLLAHGTPSALRERTGESTMNQVFISLIGNR